jgi:hypothetical protein
MPIFKKDKSDFCIDCNVFFDLHKKYQANDRCAYCYQRSYKKRLETENIREKYKLGNCVSCKTEFGSINKKGNVVKKSSKGYCKSCYYKTLPKPTNICLSCGNSMLKKSCVGLCVLCKIKNSTNPRAKKEYIPKVNKEDFETIRRLLAKYKSGRNTMVDTFRVIDIYMNINGEPIMLDTLSEEIQLVEMLRNLKKVFDFNNEK